VKVWVAKVWAVWWVGKNGPSKFCDRFLYFQTCGWACFVMLKENFIKIFVMSDCPEFLCVWIYRSELTVQTRGMISTKITSSAFQKPWLWLSLLLRRSYMIPFHWLSFMQL
jgi:hypothetical protein